METIDGRRFAHPRELSVGDTVRGAFATDGKIVLASNETYTVTSIDEVGDRWVLDGGTHRAHWSPGSKSLIEVIATKAA